MKLYRLSKVAGLWIPRQGPPKENETVFAINGVVVYMDSTYAMRVCNAMNFGLSHPWSAVFQFGAGYVFCISRGEPVCVKATFHTFHSASIVAASLGITHEPGTFT